MAHMRILIAEDDAIIAYLLGETLRAMGHEVCATEDTEAGAIASAGRCKPDLMILDEHLAPGSGVGVAEKVLRGGTVAHIFVSGDAARIRRLMPGAVVVEKPYRETDLARAMRHAMKCVGAATVPQDALDARFPS